MTGAADLRDALREVGCRFCDLVDQLGPIADELADLEARHRAAMHQAGHATDNRPAARELAVEILLNRLRSLRPFLAFVSDESAARSRSELTRPRWQDVNNAQEAAANDALAEPHHDLL